MGSATWVVLLSLLLLRTLALSPEAAEQKAREIVSKMTFKEKFRLLHSSVLKFGFTGPLTRTQQIYRLGVPHTAFFATAYPVILTLVSTWDPQLAYQYGYALSWENKQRGQNVVYGPFAELTRTPLSGRNAETWGEDPYLATKLLFPYTKAIKDAGMIGCAKHYFGATFEALERSKTNVNVPEKAFRELYFPLFKTTVEAGVGSFMCAYNKVNYTFSCQSEYLIKELLFKELNFTGIIMSDFWAMSRGVLNATDRSNPIPYVQAGVTQELPNGPTYGVDNLGKLVRQGIINESTIDDMNIRVLQTMAEMDLLDKTPVCDFFPATCFNVPTSWNKTNRILARTVLEEGAVLLKNEGSLLPIDVTKVKHISFIGSATRLNPWVTPPFLGLFYGNPIFWYTVSGPVVATTKVKPYQGVRAYLREKDIKDIKLTWTPALTRSLVRDRASKADINIIVVQALYRSGEALNRATLSFSDKDNELVDFVASVNPNTLVICIAPGASVLPWRGKVKGILAVFFPGQEFGNGLANLLFGDVNPSGKLPISFPTADNATWIQSPIQFPGVPEGDVTFTEGVFMGYRWYDAQNVTPEYAFGYGLSYTNFTYTDLEVSKLGNTHYNVEFNLTNVGAVYGKEITQLYLGFPEGAEEPPKILKGFQKVGLDPAQQKNVTLELVDEDFKTWSVFNGTWVTIPGTYHIYVGAASDRILLTDSVTVI